METGLKPCPFCGGDKVICYEQRFSKNDYRFVVVCKCGTTIIGDGWQSQKDYKTREEAIAAWNARYEKTCHLIRNEWGTPLTDQYITYDCSECGYTVGKVSKFVTYTPPNYCSHCGCKIEH